MLRVSTILLTIGKFAVGRGFVHSPVHTCTSSLFLSVVRVFLGFGRVPVATWVEGH